MTKVQPKHIQKRTRVLIVTHNFFLCETVQSCCESHPEFVWHGIYPKVEAVALHARDGDIVVLDLAEGMSAAFEFARTASGVHKLGICLHPSRDVALRAHETGMRSVLSSEDAPKKHLPLALICLRDGGSYLTPELIHLLAAGTKPDVLCPRELEALKLLSTGLGRKEICDKLGNSIRTVDALLDSAIRKLGLKGRQELREWAVKRFRES